MTSVPGEPTASRDADPGDWTAPEIRETHTGMVVLIGQRAYKGKKPIVTEFLDFSTVARREEACQREVRLNSRVAGDSYLGIAHFTDPHGGEPEPIVVMRRYPDVLRLATMVRRGAPVEGHLSAIAARIAAFHAAAARSGAIDACATLPAVRARWQQNFTELRRYLGTVLDAEVFAEIERLSLRFIAGRARLFDERIADRRIVDGHGDLIADDVFCLPEGPVLLDCLEFDDSLRYLDGLDDAAFLAMDLEFIGRPDLSEFFLLEYRRCAGDPAPASLAHLYIAYRALVRAKVDCIRFDQGEDGRAGGARRHLELALRHLRAGTARLVLIGGGPGTGKTTLARALAERLDACVISTDDVRRQMQAAGDLQGDIGVYNAGLYGSDNVDAVYGTMLGRAADLLAEGRSVVLDGTWRDLRHRLEARDTARRSSCPIVELACTIPVEEAIARIESRQATSSDATADIAAAIAKEGHTWAGAHRIDTSRPLGESVAEVTQLCCLAI